ncbi:MAG: DUF3025 domain-containing protein [Limnohabitans sp.]
MPGWWAANAQPEFYEDTGVFRPSRPQRRAEKPSAIRGIAPTA